jgi:hypothetical protein
MSRHLAITWNARTLRFVFVDADRRGSVRLLEAGQEDIAVEGDQTTLIAEAVQKLTNRLKADKARLLILMNRGAVDSATFTVPPATDAELPLLVQNLAVRDIPGATDQTPIDFIAYPQEPNGHRTVSAMALVADDQAVVKRIVDQSGAKFHRVLVSTHPLRSFIPELMKIQQEKEASSEAATLVVSRGHDVADLLMCRGSLPLLSRTIRLPAELPAVDIHRYLCSETQRTLIAASGQLTVPAKVTQVVVVGNESQTYGLDERLAEQFDAIGATVSPLSLLAKSELPETNSIADSGDFASLLAAAFEDANDVAPAVDFANPRRPPKQKSRTKIIAAISLSVLGLIGGGSYYVWSQFDEIDQENARLVTRLNDLNEMVKETDSRRQLVRLVDSWEKNRISWPDELRDLTKRIPASPEIIVQQLTISPAGPGTAVATFRGVGKQAEKISQMEAGLRDKYHDIRIPGVREQQEGDKVTATFQATLTIRKRPASQYIATDSSGDPKSTESKPPAAARKGSSVKQATPAKATAANTAATKVSASNAATEKTPAAKESP